MALEWTRSVEALILPPGGPLFAAVLGLLMAGFKRRLGMLLIAAAILVQYLASLPVIAFLLLSGLERYPALAEDQLTTTRAEAIVVLGGGRYPDAPEYGKDTVSGPLLERLRYAAHLHRGTGLPVVPSGGSALGDGPPEALLASQALRDEFDVSTTYFEGSSRTTRENARRTAQLLADRDVRRILLVTHAWHMPRALAQFEKEGLEVIAAPTAFTTREAERPLWFDWLPDAEAARATRIALHEYLGALWYRLSSG